MRLNLNSILKPTPPDINSMPTRRHDLDWLRILLFGLLIIHHVGMFYVANWGWHAKSQYRYEWLESLLLLVEPWRMPAIWFISGVSIRFLLAKIDIWRFVSLRSLRLLLPLLFGILVVVPPQLFIEMSAKGEIDMNYWQFLHAFYQADHAIFANYPHGIWPHIDVNHLWYLRSLWYYSLALVLLLPILNSQWVHSFTNWLASKHCVFSTALLILPIFLIQLLWDSNQTRYPIGFTFLLYGYLIGWNPIIWQRINSGLKPLVYLYLFAVIIFIGFYNLVWLDAIKGESIANWLSMLGMLIYSSVRVIGLLCILSIAHYLFNQHTRNLNYLNDAVYPFYILHQSIILVAGYYLTQLNLGGLIEGAALLITTIAGCFLFFEIIRRIEILRPCFGLKMQAGYSPKQLKIGYSIGGIVIAPLVLALLF